MQHRRCSTSVSLTLSSSEPGLPRLGFAPRLPLGKVADRIDSLLSRLYPCCGRVALGYGFLLNYALS
jgi:hypothetical protein